MVRVLLVADSHLGFDLPVRPRVKRRRRGHDFQANFERALAPALEGRTDLVVHGGDVFHRSRVPAPVAWKGFAPLLQVAESGVPVFAVPGNHERSRLPHARFAVHPRIHVFDRPRTFLAEVKGVRVALSGFPFERRNIRNRFPAVVDETGWRAVGADVRLLCIHQCEEPKGYMTLEVAAAASDGQGDGIGAAGCLTGWRFHELPARPMVVHEVRCDGRREGSVRAGIRAVLKSAPADAVVRIRVAGRLPASERQWLTAGRLRALAPPTMNIDLRFADDIPRPAPRPPAPGPSPVLELPF